MSWESINLVFLLGAGASKPLGLPVSKEIVKNFLDQDIASPLSELKTQIISEKWDIEKFMRLIQHIIFLGKEPPLKDILGEFYTDEISTEINRLNTEYKKIYEDLLIFIRNSCLDPDIEKAIEIYEPLLKLSEENIIKIFTTNYDTSIEDVCKTLHIKYNDCFDVKDFDEYRKFYPDLMGIGNPQLYKLHGSVNWWSDESRKDIFRLSLDLEGISEIKRLMIYPTEAETSFNYPFNILQSQYILSLIDADFVLVIGHKFADINISLPLKALLEKPDFELMLVNPSADTIKKDIFNDNANITSVPKPIEEWMPVNIDDLIEKITEIKNKKQETQEKEQRRVENIINQRVEARERARWSGGPSP